MITKITLLASYGINDPNRSTQEKWEIPKNGICLVFTLVVRADISWPGDGNQAAAAETRIKKLAAVGVFDRESLKSLDARLWSSTFAHCIVEIDDLAHARDLFAKATTDPDRVVDIYLYQDGIVIDKLD